MLWEQPYGVPFGVSELTTRSHAFPSFIPRKGLFRTEHSSKHRVYLRKEAVVPHYQPIYSQYRSWGVE